MEVEKRWVYLRDGRARAAHRDIGGAGWVPLHHVYADGRERPPTDGGCRCVLMYRVRPGSEAPEAGAGALGAVSTLSALAALIRAVMGGAHE